MKEHLNLEIDLHTLAIKLVEEGVADPLLMLLNYAALEIQQRYARQLPVRQRFETFRNRSKTHLDDNAVMLLQCITHAS